jgi:hypothetical protein
MEMKFFERERSDWVSIKGRFVGPELARGWFARFGSTFGNVIWNPGRP